MPDPGGGSVVSCQLSVVSCQWAVGSGQWAVVSGQLSVVSCQLSVVSGQWSVVSGQWSVASGQWPVVSCQLSVGSGQWSGVGREGSPEKTCGSGPVDTVLHNCTRIRRVRGLEKRRVCDAFCVVQRKGRRGGGGGSRPGGCCRNGLFYALDSFPLVCRRGLKLRTARRLRVDR